MRNLILILAISFISATFAQQDFKSIVQDKADTYFVLKAVKADNTKHDCLPRRNIVDPVDCMNSICTRVSRIHCDDATELRSHLSACQGNFGGSCVDAVCDRLSGLECDNTSELHQIARACSLIDNQCIDIICSRVSRFDCDSRSELLVHLKSCQGVDAGCVESVCSRLSAHECDDVSEVRQVMDSCRL